MALILIVDDDPNTLCLLEINFSVDGNKVIKASSGKEAIELANRYKPRLMVLDMMMPDKDGLEVCREIRGNPETANILILMLTAVRTMDKKLSSFEAGADDYLTKPVHPEELRSRVRVLLDRAAKISQAEPQKKENHVVAVIGAGGGVGTSTVALNLAASIIDEHPDTVLAELIPGGSLALQLGLKPEKNLFDLAGQSETTLNYASIQEVLLSHPCGLSLLPAGVDFRLGTQVETLRAGHVQRIIHELSDQFQYVFLDMGQGYNSRVQAAQSMITDYVMVIRAEEIALQTSRQQLKLFQEKGISPRKIYIALVAFSPYPYTLDSEKAGQMLRLNGDRENILLYIPPIQNLIFMALEQHIPAVLKTPEGDLLLKSFKTALSSLTH